MLKDELYRANIELGISYWWRIWRWILKDGLLLEKHLNYDAIIRYMKILFKRADEHTFHISGCLYGKSTDYQWISSRKGQ